MEGRGTSVGDCCYYSQMWSLCSVPLWCRVAFVLEMGLNLSADNGRRSTYIRGELLVLCQRLQHENILRSLASCSDAAIISEMDG
jgi:hypothetical protein